MISESINKYILIIILILSLCMSIASCRTEFEPIFSKEDAEEWRGSHTSDIEEIMESYVYETEISQYSYIYASKRYDEHGGRIHRLGN